MNQISQRTDHKLHELSARIGRAKEAKEAADKEFDEAWQEVFDLFDEHGLEGQRARFVAKDQHYLYKMPVGGSPKLTQEGENKLHELLTENVWRKVSVAVHARKVIPALLEKAVLEGKVSQEVLDQCIKTPETRFSRIREPWTKEDHERAIIYGLNSND